MFSVPPSCTHGKPVTPTADMFYATSNDLFLGSVLGAEPKVVYRGEDTAHDMQVIPRFETTDTSLAPNLLLHAMHQASLAHAGVELTPDVLWYATMHTLAEYQRRGMGDISVLAANLAASPLTIQTAQHFDYVEWPAVVYELFQHMLKLIPGDMVWQWLPRLAGSNFTSELAAIATLFGGPNPQHRYQPQVGNSHIAQLRFGGANHDWPAIHRKLNDVTPSLNWDYRLHVGQVLSVIANAARNGKVDRSDFWDMAYRYVPRPDGDLIHGWITAFFGYDYRSLHPSRRNNDWSKHLRHASEGQGWPVNSFTSHVSTVPFILEANGTRDVRRMTLVTGITAVEHHHGFLKPALGITVIED